MSSSIFFKFKSQKEPSPITFDGTSLSVFEVKREIIVYNKLGDGTDFDLEIYSADTNEGMTFGYATNRTPADSSAVYDDDTVQIPRSTTVIARRLPATKPGAGRAARYVSGKMPVTTKNAHRIENMGSTTSRSTPLAQVMSSGQPLTEEEKLQAMFSENKASWQEAQAEIAAKGVNNKPFFSSKSAPAPDKPVPDGYICHRCGQKGHWIQACPTNTDPNFDGRPKFRRTTGIPKSFLQKIEKPLTVGEDGKIDVSQLPSGVMYTPEGEWVVSRPDEASWQKFQDQNKATAEQQKAVAEELEDIRARGLECPLSNALFEDPVKTPCCNTAYSRAAIENELIEKDFVCPSCGEQVLLDDLKADEETAAKVKEYKAEKASQKVDSSTIVMPEVDETATADNPTKSPSPTPSKKRTAEEELEKAEPEKKHKAIAKEDTPATAAPGMQVPKNTADFVAQMNQMFGTVPGMPNGMPPFNPMMMNPMMMNGMMGMGMPGMPMMGPNMMQMPMGPGFSNGGAGPSGPQGWQGNQPYNGQQGNDGAYFRQAVNPNRRRGRQNRPRSMDYKQV